MHFRQRLPLFAAFGVGILLTVTAFSFGPSLLTTKTVSAANNCQNFPQTGHQICGKFLTYWQTHGGLAQQGYPISDTFQERNAPPPAGDGQIHTVQYFERARFEQHDENQPPYDTLLGLLGSEQFHAKYPSGTPGVPVTQMIVINSKTTADTIGFSTAKPGNTFLVFDLTLTNTISKVFSANPAAFTAKAASNYAYDWSGVDDPKELKLLDLQPGDSERGTVAFEIPKTETITSLIFDSYPAHTTVTVP